MDRELAQAPNAWAFLGAISAKYGIPGLVVLFLGYTSIQKDSQIQDQNKMLISVLEKNTSAQVANTEINRRMIEYLERRERNSERADRMSAATRGL